MALKDKRKELIEYIRNNSEYLKYNADAYDILQGGLKKYVEEIMRSALSAEYFSKIQHRLIIVNILEKYISKVSIAYDNPPTRTAALGQEQYQEIIDYYVSTFNLNKKMGVADSYSHLFKGFALEPYLDNEKPKLRVMPYDRFLPYSDNNFDPTSETVLIKLMGEVTKEVIGVKNQITQQKYKLYYTYSAEEFDAFTDDGETYAPALADNEGINDFGVIPITYGNRVENELLPTQDTDILSMTKIMPVVLSDLSGAILFQCFSIIYGVDVDFENATISPNALWSMKSDKSTDKNPIIGILKPEADIEKVKEFILSVFILWLDTKGVRVGSVGAVNNANVASGVSKVMDEMDVQSVVKKSIDWFVQDEKEFWAKMIPIHNHWVDMQIVKGFSKLPEDLTVIVKFPEMVAVRSRKELIEEKKIEVDSGFKSRKKAMMELNPDMSEEDLATELELIKLERSNTGQADQVVNGQI